MTLATFETSVQNFFVTTETFVQNVITQVKNAEAVAMADLDSALKWVASNTPTIVADIEQVIGFAGQVGLASTPAGVAAIAAAQVAIATLNAVAQSQNTGASDIQTLLAGYTAVKQAQAAAATTAAAAATSVVVKAA